MLPLHHLITILIQKVTSPCTREFDTFPNEKQRISRMNAYIFLSNLLFLYIGFFGFLRYNGIEVKKLKVNTSKSKNAESFYIKQSYIDSNGKSTSRTIRKLGTLKELLVEHGPTRDDVMAWAKEQARIETEKFEQEKANHCIPITFHPNRKIAHGEKRKFQGGYLFLQSLYYELGLNKVCRKIRDKHHYDYDLNAILSDLIYTRILEPGSKRSSFETAKNFLEAPTYQLHDIYRALNVLSEECDLIQSELYRNSKSVLKRNDGVLYYDCTNYYFEIEQEDGDKKYGKSKEHRPNPIVQMGLFTDGDGIPLAFSIFPGNQNEQTSLKPLEKKVIEEFGCEEFIFCSDAGLGSENNRLLNHSKKRSYIVTQSIKKLPEEYRTLALNKKGFRCLSDHKAVDLNSLMFKMEKILARASKAAGDNAMANQYETLANARQKGIEKYLWNDQQGWYADYDLKSHKVRNQLTAAALFPLYVNAAAKDRANKMATATKTHLLQPGGLNTTSVKSGQQWDAPNGWAPLQWVATEGLQNYGQKEVAMDISWHFLTNVQHTYDREKKLVEKYDVSTTGTGGGGGEYPLQDGFGWTNGVTLKMLDLICPKEQPCDNVPATRPTVKSATTQPSTKEAQPTP